MSSGDKCNNCGECCNALPCGIALELIEGCNPPGPCPALEFKDGKYYCGLLIHSSQYIDLGENVEWKNKWLRDLFSQILGIGMGCCSCPEFDYKDLRGMVLQCG